jgi:hypothetical protein
MPRIADCQPTATSSGVRGSVSSVARSAIPSLEIAVAHRHRLRLDSGEQLHIALPARGAIVRSTVAEERASTEATGTGRSPKSVIGFAIIGWLVHRKETGCRSGGDPGSKRYRATSFR